MARHHLVALGVILVVALALRLAWALYAARPPKEFHDPTFYRFFAEQIANGNGYRLLNGEPTAYYPIGYPLSLGVAFWFVYNTPLPDTIETGVIAGLNIAYQLAAIVLVFTIARRLVRGGVVAGLVAAATVALWPNLVFHTAVALTESLFIVLLLGALLLALPERSARVPVGRVAMAGVLLGAATLVRPVSLPVVPALFAAWVVAGWGWRRALAVTGVLVATMVVVLAPWAIRNVIVMNELTLSTNSGDNLCMSRRVGASGEFEWPNRRCLEGPFGELPRPEMETARDAYGRRLAFEFVTEHPVEELRLIGRRARHTFDGDADALRAVESYGNDRFLTDGTRSALRRAANVYGGAVAVVAVAGLVLLARRRPRETWAERLLVVLAVVALLVPPLVTFGDQRFHVPAAPLAAVAVGFLVQELAARRGSPHGT